MLLELVSNLSLELLNSMEEVFYLLYRGTLVGIGPMLSLKGTFR
jgi:hypothetical protein